MGTIGVEQSTTTMVKIERICMDESGAMRNGLREAWTEGQEGRETKSGWLTLLRDIGKYKSI